MLNYPYYFEGNEQEIDIATLEKAGIVRPDGKTITIDNLGVISSIGGGGGGGPANIDIATDESAGIVKPDNTTIKVNTEGVISAVQPEEILNPVVSELLTLNASNWINNSQKVACTIDTLKQNIVAPTFSELLIWAGCEVYPQIEESDGITFICATPPEKNLTFKITSIGGNRQVLSFPYIYNGRETLNDEELLYTFDAQGHPILKEEITIPASVSSIDVGIFDKIYGSKTQKIVLKKGSVLNRIVGSAFASNSSLKEIDLSNATRNISIEASAFANASALQSIKISDKYKLTLEKQAFQNTKISNDIAQNIVTNSATIADSAFQNCSEITNLISTTCSTGSFASIPNLTSLEINMEKPSSVVVNSICENDSSLSEVKITGLTNLGSSCFSGCSNLKTIALDPNTKAFGDSCFSGCSLLQGIDFPKNVTAIPRKCFENCTSITEMTIPDSIISLGEYAFSGTNIEKIYYHLSKQQSTYAQYIFSNMAQLTEAGIIDDLAETNSRYWNINTPIGDNQGNVYYKYQNSPVKKWTEGRRINLSGQNYVWSCFYNLEELDIKYKFVGTLANLTAANLNNPFYFAFTDMPLKTIHLPDDWTENVVISNGGANWANLLTRECMVEMFGKLHDYTGKAQHTFTLGTTNLARLTDEDKKIATNKNWELA